eukprot:768230-Hanusia_phi.AAC.3
MPRLMHSSLGKVRPKFKFTRSEKATGHLDDRMNSTLTSKHVYTTTVKNSNQMSQITENIFPSLLHKSFDLLSSHKQHCLETVDQLKI